MELLGEAVWREGAFDHNKGAVANNNSTIQTTATATATRLRRGHLLPGIQLLTVNLFMNHYLGTAPLAVVK